MSTRWNLKAWVALSVLAVFLLFATVAAEAMLQGTRPPAKLVRSQTDAALCTDGSCRTGISARGASRASATATCPEASRFTTI